MLLRIHPKNPQDKNINQVVECLKDGGIIIYPTDTVYGLGCDIFKQKAVDKIARIKEVNIKKHNFLMIDRSPKLFHVTKNQPSQNAKRSKIDPARTP